MQIQYYGDFCFKITTKPEGRATDDVVIWTDPLPKGAGLRSPQGEPDLLLLSHDAEDTRKDGYEGKVVLDMPGEFSVRGIALTGHESFTRSAGSKEAKFNTIYHFDSEELQVAFLGSLGHEPDADTLDSLSGTDILFVPANSTDGWNLETAIKTIKNIEPRIVIPMHYQMEGLKVDGLSSEKALTDALGMEVERTAKLTLKKKDVAEGANKIVVIEKG